MPISETDLSAQQREEQQEVPRARRLLSSPLSASPSSPPSLLPSSPLHSISPSRESLSDDECPPSPSPPTSSESPTCLPPAALPRGISTVLRYLRAHRVGRLEESCVSIHIRPEENQQLWKHLELRDPALAAYAKARVRYEYDEELSCCTIRMPTSAHEHLCRRVSDEITRQLQNIADTTQDIHLQPMLRLIRDRGSADIKLSTASFCADASFWHDSAPYPSVVLEVAYSQSPKDLLYRADTLIIESRGAISTVIGLDLEYKTGGASRGRIWRLQSEIDESGQRVMSSTEAWNREILPDGVVQPGSISIPLQDFVPRHLSTPAIELATAPHSIVLGLSLLARFVRDAITAQDIVANTQPPAQVQENGIIWKKRKRTPPMEISEETEARFHRDAEAVQTRLSAEDPNWDGGERAPRRNRRRRLG